MLRDFEIELPSKCEVINNITDKNLYVHDFISFSLTPLQQTASFFLANNIKEKMNLSIFQGSQINKIANNEKIEYVAKFSDLELRKISSGELKLGIRRKTGETYAVLKDSVTGRTKSSVTLEKKVVQDLGSLPELSVIQGQLALLLEQMESLNRVVQRVEQGQYNDRFSGFFATRQLLIEGLSAQDEYIRKNLLLSAIKISNETIGKLMFSIHHDSVDLVDTKIKPKEAVRIDALLQNSLGYLNSCVQLNLIIYTALCEHKALFASLVNYQTFIEQNLLNQRSDGKSTAWLLDNGHRGENGKIFELTNAIVKKIDVLTTEYQLEELEVHGYEKDENG